jgi:hypothetical protein
VEDERPKTAVEMIAYIAVALMAFILVAFAWFLYWHGD